MNTNVLAIDLAKSVFQVHGLNVGDKAKLTKRLSRNALMPFIATLPECTIFIEACSGAHHWSRAFEQHGHVVKIISPQYVKPFVKGSKNDANDARAILEASLRPDMNFVPKKSKEQQEVQSIHRVRSSLIQKRTGLGNQIRGFLAEFGIVLPTSLVKLRNQLPGLLSDYDNELTDSMRGLLWELYDDLLYLDERVSSCDKKLQSVLLSNKICQRLSKVEGIGVITATAAFAKIGDGKVFKNGRHCSAYLGLVPKEHSSGNKQKLLGISKRGDAYLRTLLIQGAKAAVRVARNHNTKKSRWITSVVERRGSNVAAVALANKNARTIWSMIVNGTEYMAAA